MQWVLVLNGTNRSGAGARAKNLGCLELEPEPEICVSTPQPWFQRLQTLPLAFYLQVF